MHLLVSSCYFVIINLLVRLFALVNSYYKSACRAIHMQEKKREVQTATVAGIKSISISE